MTDCDEHREIQQGPSHARRREEDAQRYPDHDDPRRTLDPGSVREAERRRKLGEKPATERPG